MTGWKSVTGATVLLVAGMIALGAPGAAGPLPTGTVKIKGVRWVDGAKTKIRCSRGHTLGLEPDRRTLTLAVDDSKCGIAADAASFVFEGAEDVLFERGKQRPKRTFAGAETQTEAVTGMVNSILSLARDGSPKKTKGTLAYVIDDGGPVVVFLGTYSAKGF